MPYIDYVPTRSGDYWIWEAQFVAYATSHQADLDFTVDEVATLGAADGAANSANNAMFDARDGYEAAVELKDEKKAELTAIIRALAQKYQANLNATDVHREGLGITVPDREPTPVSEDAAATTPSPMVLCAAIERGQMVVHFGLHPTDEGNNAKPDHMRVAEIWCAKGGIPGSDEGAGPWQYVASDSNSPYIHYGPDTASGTLAYKARWVDVRNRPGPFGDPVTIAYTA